MAKVDVGDAAPDFELPGTGGKTYRLSDYRGRKLVLAFYPGDFTAVCTKQFCSYRDQGERLDGLGADVLGISPQSVDSHERFSEEKRLNVPLLADEDKRVASAYGVVAGPMVRRAIFVDRRGGHRPLPQGVAGRAHLRVGRRPRAGARRGRLMAGAEPAPFAVGAAPGDPRRGGGGGAADRPLPRDHRDPALRPPRLAGAGAGRPPGASPTTPAATASPTRPRRTRVMDTRGWSATSSGSSRPRWGRGRFVLAGHSMGAHTAVAYALRHPERLAGLVVIGPVYAGEISADSLTYWDGLAEALERAASTASSTTSTAQQGIDPAWRDSVLRFTRERMLRAPPPRGAGPGAARGAALAALRVAGRAGAARAAGAGRRQPRRGRSRAIPTRSPPPTRSGCRGRG